MLKVNYFLVALAMGIMFVVGLVLIFNVPSFGLRAANNFLVSLGGSMDTAQFHIILTSYIRAYNTGGLILSLIGGLGCLIASYIETTIKE